jgi:hypothetical protein
LALDRLHRADYAEAQRKKPDGLIGLRLIMSERGNTPECRPRGSCRKIIRLLSIVMFLAAPGALAADAAFRRMAALALGREAQRLGISRKVFDDATRGLEPDLTLPDLVVLGRP